jgi:cytochrome c-type biogenesis protein CcmH
VIEPQTVPLAVTLFITLLLVTLALLTRPWWSRTVAVGLARRGANVAAYRGRIVEIDRDVEAGVIPADEAKVLKDEAAERLLGDTEADLPAVADNSSSRVIGVVVAVLITIASAGAYWQVGAWRPPPPEAVAQSGDGQEGKGQEGKGTLPPQVQAMVQRLADRLAQQPDDPAGWNQLGRAYFVMKRFEESATAYHQANARNGGEDAESLTSEGEAIAFSSQMRIPDEAKALFAHALKIDPDQGRALWYDGLAAAQSGDLATARTDWTRLRTHDLPDQMKPVLDRAIAQLGDAGAGERAVGPVNGKPGPAGGASSAPSDAQSIMLKSSAVQLKLNVKLAPQLASQMGEGATLFVYAKADGGPPMPLAVYRAPVGSFPVAVTLDDSMAMAPTMRLSAFPRYVVTARISRSGQATPQPGDLQGSVHVERDAANAKAGVHEVIIDQAVP